MRNRISIALAGAGVLAAGIAGASALASPSQSNAPEPARTCMVPQGSKAEQPAPQKVVSAQHTDGSLETTVVESPDAYTVNQCDAQGDFRSSRQVVTLDLPSGRTVKVITHRVDAQPDGTLSEIIATPSSDVALLEAYASDRAAQREIPEPTAMLGAAALTYSGG